MKKNAWKKKIKEACESIGTYKSEFDSVIDALATILEQRDAAFDQYEKTGAHPVITHTNSRHEKNYVRNPMLVQWSELNKDALTYWRDLGLTPKGFHALTGDTAFKKQKKGLAETLKELGI